MLVNTRLKIALCPIEKVASSQFRQVKLQNLFYHISLIKGPILYCQLFFRMEGDENWFEPPYHSKLNHSQLNLFPLKVHSTLVILHSLPFIEKGLESFQRMKRAEVERIMNDDSFIKAVIFRDPPLRYAFLLVFCTNKIE